MREMVSQTRRDLLLGIASYATVCTCQDVVLAGAANGAKLILRKSGSGLKSTVAVESLGQFRLHFSAAHNWGLHAWYDLVNDPLARNNLLFYSATGRIPDVIEPALFQQAYYGTNPDDPKLFTTAAQNFFPNARRSFSIISDGPDQIILRSVSSPVANAVGVLSNVVVVVQYDIRPDGRIFVQCDTHAVQPQTIYEWRGAIIGLGDPTSGEAYARPDSEGWIRCSAGQNPYQWVEGFEPYIYAYWSPISPEPFAEWCRASVLMVPKPGNSFQGRQGMHNWPGFKRLYYTTFNLKIPAGGAVTQQYMIRLGARGSKILPDISNAKVARQLANEYRKDPDATMSLSHR